jgi:ATP-dependent DNA helicase RecG
MSWLMTTPIPRTLAMSLYGDLDISVIDELPPGETHSNRASFWLKPTESLEIYRDQIAIGRQIYIVYPLIQESAKWISKI